MIIKYKKLISYLLISVLLRVLISYIFEIKLTLINYAQFFTLLIVFINYCFAKEYYKLGFSFIIYSLISFGFYKYLGLDPSLLTTSLYLFFSFPILLNETDLIGKKHTHNLILAFSILLILSFIIDIKLLWFDRCIECVFKRALTLGYSRKYLSHIGPVYIPIGLLNSNHSSAFISFLLSLYFIFNRKESFFNTLLGIILMIVGFFFLSITNAIVYISALFIFSGTKGKILFSGILILLSSIFIPVISAKFSSDNISNFYTHSSLSNIFNDFPTLFIGHGSQLKSNIILSEIAFIKIIFEYGLLVFFLVFGYYRKLYLNLNSHNKPLFYFFIASLIHYGDSFRFISVSTIVILISLNKKNE